MKILLIAPSTPNPSSSYFGPPYALAIFGAMLKERGHTVTAEDLSRQCEADMTAALPGIVERDAPDLIGLSCLGINRGITVRVIRLLKALCPQTSIIVGGPYPTQSPMEFFERSPVDFVCVGDGEETLMELVSALDADQDVGGIAGLVHRRHGVVVRNAPRAQFTDLDSLPFPDFDLFDVARHLRDFARPKLDAALAKAGSDGRMGYRANAALMVIGSRGCVFQCSFCPMSKQQPRLRLHDPAYTAEMMIHYRDRYGITDFVMGDNLFSVPRERAWKLCEELINRKAGLSWICMTRADTVDPELLEKMAAAGCREISYGVETLSWDVQRAMKKNLRTAPIVEVYRQTHAANIQSNLMLMLGNEGESRASVRATTAGCRAIRPDRILLNVTKVYTGTVLYDRAVANGMFEPSYFTMEDPDVREYTVENSAAELRVMEQMLQRRTSYLRLTDDLCADTPDEQAIERALAMMDLRSEQVIFDVRGLSRVEQLWPVLTRASWLKLKRLWLHGNAALWSRRARMVAVQKSRKVQGIVVPIFSTNEAHHDQIAGKPGALLDARKGLINWTRGGGDACIWAYLDRLNVSLASAWVHWAKAHRVKRMLFVVGRDPAGWHETVDLPDLNEAGRAISQALKVAKTLDIEVEVTGLPECLLDADPLVLHELWRPFDEVVEGDQDPQATAELRQRDKHQLAACERCHVQHHCEGLWTQAPPAVVQPVPSEAGRDSLAVVPQGMALAT